MVNGTFERQPDQLVINTFGSNKLESPDFPAGWNIDHYKDAAKVFQDLGKTPDQLDAAVRGPIDTILAGRTPAVLPGSPDYVKEFRKARVEKTFDDILAQEGITPATRPDYLDERAKRMQSLADSRKGLDQVENDPTYKRRDGRAPEQIDKIREVMDTLQADDAIPKTSDDNGVEYRRRSFTNQPGVVETVPGSDQPIYLRQVADPTSTTGFRHEKYVVNKDPATGVETEDPYTP